MGVALYSWHPTAGTRLTGKRNTAARLAVTGGRMTPLASPPPVRAWDFPEPFGTRQMVELPFTEVVTIARHLRSPEIHAYMNVEPLAALRAPHTPAPVADDDPARSAQRFLLQVTARYGGSRRPNRESHRR